MSNFTTHFQLTCIHRGTCGACLWPQGDLAAQSLAKQQKLTDALAAAGFDFLSDRVKSIEVIAIGADFRERVDLVILDGQLGYYAQTQSGERKNFRLTECQLLTAPLLQWVQDFSKIQWPIKKGSVRLRISPNSRLRGVWLDFANLDTKALLENSVELNKLLAQKVVVEMGQKRKVLCHTSNGLKLREPRAEIWSETLYSGQTIPLYSLVGNFTQTGTWANHHMAHWVDETLSDFKANTVIEFGSGVGTLTWPAASSGRSVLACEVDELACDSLERGLHEFKSETARAPNIKILRGDFQNKTFVVDKKMDAFLINPPRSGMGKFDQSLKGLEQLPQAGLYMSCYLESFIKDAHVLKTMGFELTGLKILDQFPWTEHFEILASFKMKSSS